jgi:3-dehydroquinate dehydratase II
VAVKKAAKKTAGRGRAKAEPATKSAARVMVLSGPNLDRLGKREPHIYGSTTLKDIHAELEELGAEFGLVLDCRQSNHEGDLVTWIGEAADRGYVGLLINPGALTHTSYALYDAIKGAGVPAVELHLSNPDAREEFRRESRVAPAVLGRVAGFGAGSYALALRGLLGRLAAG